MKIASKSLLQRLSILPLNAFLKKNRHFFSKTGKMKSVRGKQKGKNEECP